MPSLTERTTESSETKSVPSRESATCGECERRIKEFKSGPLANFVLVHNKAATVTSFDELIRWVASLCDPPHRLGTALEAIESATAGRV
jgi:hypothetical protein